MPATTTLPVRTTARATTTTSTIAKHWYKASEVAQLLDIDVRTLWRWISEEKVPEPRRAGKRNCGRPWVRWPVAQIEELLATIGT